MANTPSFNWETPDDTDLVKDGALAIRTLGNAIDASMTDLKGGTTGQLLSKASNTDMDFTWTAAPTSGGLTLISTSTLSAATSISFTSIDTSYKQLFLVISEIYQSAENVYWSVRLNNDSTSGNYYYRTFYVNNNTVTSVYGGTSSTAFGADPYDAPIPTTRADDFPAQKGYGIFTINGSDLTAAKTVSWSTSGYRPGSAQQVKNFGDGVYVGSSAVSRIDLIRSSTQSITGKIYLYGVK